LTRAAVGEVEVKHVALVKCEEVDQLQDETFRHEVASDVEKNTAPREPRSVDDLQLGYRDGLGAAGAAKG
jgi:hypothetical protein